MSLTPGTRLGTYEIVSILGAGGMGEVYRARDAKLDRDVAIKVLPSALTNDADALARFKREARAVGALSHQNILAIHDFGNQDGIVYAVTELLEGVTLRTRLDAGPLPQKQTLDYALQIGKGLAAAHEKGVIHRDLKPENLFITRDGHLKILDFGLAKKIGTDRKEDESATPTARLDTEPGTVLGTVGYMSPEQVRGVAVDARSDLFSFGAVLYEMLAGKRAFRRETAADTLVAILTEEPAEIVGESSSVSAPLDRVLRHCLEKRPEDRFFAAKDVVFALTEVSSGTVTSVPRAAPSTPVGWRRALPLAAVVAMLGVAGVILWRPDKPVQSGGPKRIAVLPFENLGSAADEYFADGITDEVRGKLTALSGLEVIARASSTPYKKTKKSPAQIAQELGVQYLLTATLRWEKAAGVSRVYVSPELVEVSGSATPASRWQQPFNAELTDVFQVQSDIATRVAEALGVALGAREEKRLDEKPTKNLAAYDAFLRGEASHNSNGSGDAISLGRSLEAFEQAVALDPGFAKAWAQISRASSVLYFNSVPTPALAERARLAAERAVALAPVRPEGYLALGMYQRLVANDSRRALEQYLQGQRLEPGNAEILSLSASAEESLGRWEEAVEHYRQSEHLDPRSVRAHHRFGQALLVLRRYAQAHETIDRGLALAPASLSLIEDKSMAFLAEGNLAGARAALRSAPAEVEPTSLVAFVAQYWDLVWVLDDEQRDVLLRLTPGAFDDDKGTWVLCLTQAYALKGDMASVRHYAGEARTAFEEQLRVAPEDGQRHLLLGVSLAYLGRHDEAVKEGLRGMALLPMSKDALLGAYNQHQLARIYILVGEPEKALDQLEPLLKLPYFLSPGWLKIDPNFEPLRTNPRFQRLVAGG